MCKEKEMISSNVDPKIVKPLILSGKARVTFYNPKSGGHITIKVKQAPAKKKGMAKPNVYFVRAKVLGDSEHSYVYAGTIFTDNWGVSYEKTGNTQLHQILRFVLSVLRDDTYLERTGAKVQHEGVCMRCGKELTEPHSIETGLGPICYKNISDYSPIKVGI